MPTRKELRRIKKADLLEICLDNNIECNRKSSKNSLVDKIFKNKKLRGSLPVPPPRQISEKQRANLTKFRYKKTAELPVDVSANVRKAVEVAAPSKPNPRSRVELDPTASNRNEEAPDSLLQNPSDTNKGKAIAKATPVEKPDRKAKVEKAVAGKTQVVGQFGESKGGKVERLEPKSDKKFRDKASEVATQLRAGLHGSVFDAKRMRSVDSHTARLRRRVVQNKKKDLMSNHEFLVSTIKTTDQFDRNLFNRHTSRNNKGMDSARGRATKTQNAAFDGDLEELGEDLLVNDLGELKSADSLKKVNEILEIEELFRIGHISKEQRDKFIAQLTASPDQLPTGEQGREVAPQEAAAEEAAREDEPVEEVEEQPAEEEPEQEEAPESDEDKLAFRLQKASNGQLNSILTEFLNNNDITPQRFGQLTIREQDGRASKIQAVNAIAKLVSQEPGLISVVNRVLGGQQVQPSKSQAEQELDQASKKKN
jgi:hypothetical protein